MLVDGPGPVFQLYFTEETEVNDYRAFAATDLRGLQRFHSALMERGINTIGRGLWFVSAAHGQREIDETLAAVQDILSAW
jgi:glutamate-1-semialdehyde 2,1-aminomutase